MRQKSKNKKTKLNYRPNGVPTVQIENPGKTERKVIKYSQSLMLVQAFIKSVWPKSQRS